MNQMVRLPKGYALGHVIEPAFVHFKLPVLHSTQIHARNRHENS